MEVLKKLRESRAKLMEQWAELIAHGEKREWTPEETQLVAQLQAKVDDLDKRITACEAFVNADQAMDEAEQNANDMNNGKPPGVPDEMKGRNAPAPEATRPASTRRAAPVPGYVSDYNDRQAKRDRNMALRGWFLGDEAGNEHRAAAERCGVSLSSRSLSIPLWELGRDEELRDNTTSGSAGGYTVPQGFLAELNKRLVLFNPMRDVARVIQTETGNPMPLPTVDDSSNSASLTSEGSASSATDLTFGQKTLNAYTYRSLVKASNELLRDSGIDIQSYIAELLGDRIGRAEASAFTTGTGSSQPEGFIQGASAGVTAAGATAITINDIVGLINSLDAWYQPNARFVMHQAIWFYLLKLQDSYGRQLIPINYGDSVERRLFGFPVVLNNAMQSSVATTTKTIAFGDFSQFYIRDSGPLIINRLDERYADAYETGFLAVGRRDSKVIQTNAIKLLTQA